MRKKNSILTDRFKEYNKNKSYYDLVNNQTRFEEIFPNVDHDQLAIIEPEQFSQYVITALRDNNKAKIEAGQINLNNYYKYATTLINQIQARNDIATDDIVPAADTIAVNAADTGSLVSIINASTVVAAML